MTQFEFYKSFQFILELLLAESLFLKNLLPRRYFVLRILGGTVAVFLIAYFFPIASNDALYMSFMFFALFAVTVFAGKFVFDESWFKILFCCLAGYTVQHLAYEFYNLALTIMNVNRNTPMGSYGNQTLVIFPNAFIAIVYFYIYIVIYYFAGFFFGKMIKEREKLQIKSTLIFLLSALIVAVDIILNAFVVNNLAPEGNRTYLVIVGIYNILCCMIALVLQFEVTLRHKLEESLNAITLIRRQEREQYNTSKETIELINMKCHDLKHQIRNMGGSQTINEESAKKIEDLISIYDSTVRTGNEALDTILTEKKLYCTKKHIKLSCIADGQKLDFMSDEDIYSLFGNVLDNAMEAVEKLDDDKRVIGLRIRAVGNLLSVNVHNYYQKRLKFEDGIPQTTKTDKRFHGYGLKSVKYVCDKYGGDLSINAEHNVFTINVMFSLEPKTV